MQVERAQGCHLGQLVGDALGSLVEQVKGAVSYFTFIISISGSCISQLLSIPRILWQ